MLGLRVDEKQGSIEFEVTNGYDAELPITPSTRDGTTFETTGKTIDGTQASSNDVASSDSETQPSSDSTDEISPFSENVNKNILKCVEKICNAPQTLSICSESTDAETVSRDTTPMLESKNLFLVPDASLEVDTAEVNSLPVVYVEESQTSGSPLQAESVSEVVSETPPSEVLSQPPPLEKFSSDINSENCSTQQNTPTFDVNDSDRRSSKRLLSKRSNSEDKSSKSAVKLFKKIKSSEDFPNVPVNSSKIDSKKTPKAIKQRRSLRIRNKDKDKLLESPTKVKNSSPSLEKPVTTDAVKLQQDNTTGKMQEKKEGRSLNTDSVEVVSIPDSQKMPSISSLDSSSTTEVELANDDKQLPNPARTDVSSRSSISETLPCITRSRSKKHSLKKDKSPKSRGLITSYLTQSPKLDKGLKVSDTEEETISGKESSSEAGIDGFYDEIKVTLNETDEGSKPRGRKQSNPKMVVQPPRKSLRLNRKSNSKDNLGMAEGAETTFIPDSQESQVSEIVSLHDDTPEFVPDSLQQPKAAINTESTPPNSESDYTALPVVTESQVSEIVSLHDGTPEFVPDSLQQPKAAINTESTPPNSESDYAALPVLTDDLSIEITSSDKNKVLSSNKSVESVEPFGQPTINPIIDSLAETAPSPYSEDDKIESSRNVICRDSPEPVLAPDDKLLLPDCVKVIPDSQADEKSPKKMDSLSRKLCRTTSISSNLPRVIMNTIAEETARSASGSNDSATGIEVPQHETKDVEIKTPPKSLNFLSESSPRTPSSILKKMGTPSSRSPSCSNRRVTFGPLPGKQVFL